MKIWKTSPLKDGLGGDIKTKVEDKQYSTVVLFKEGFTAVPSVCLEENLLNCKIMRKYSPIHDKDNDLIGAGNTPNLYL